MATFHFEAALQLRPDHTLRAGTLEHRNLRWLDGTSPRRFMSFCVLQDIHAGESGRVKACIRGQTLPESIDVWEADALIGTLVNVRVQTTAALSQDIVATWACPKHPGQSPRLQRESEHSQWT